MAGLRHECQAGVYNHHKEILVKQHKWWHCDLSQQQLIQLSGTAKQSSSTASLFEYSKPLHPVGEEVRNGCSEWEHTP